MSKFTRALLVAAVAMSPRVSSATNYHEYKKFDVSPSTERMPSKCRATLKEHRHHNYHCDTWQDFWHHN